MGLHRNKKLGAWSIGRTSTHETIALSSIEQCEGGDSESRYRRFSIVPIPDGREGSE